MKRFVILFVLTACSLSTPMLGQAETTGRISGGVVDEEGNPIAGARVTLISSALQGERTTETDEKGEFLAGLLPVGPYAVRIAAPGKETVQISLRIGVAQTIPLAVTMSSGEEIVEKVTVYAAATPLGTTVVGESFEYDTDVEELPIAVRNILNVSSYSPNVVEGPWTPDVLVGQSAGLVISGAPAYETIVQLEGTDISDAYFGQGLLLYLEDAVEDIQVMTSGIPARYGRFEGGVINTITKTGGNEFNGTVRAEFFKESWNSTTPFGEEQSDNLNEVYQVTFGGYMLKDKLWFFTGARSVPTRTVSGTTVLTGESFQGETDDQRWQLKLRGAPSPDHVLEASYLQRDFETTGLGGVAYGDLLAATSYFNEEPMSLFTLAYQGILGPASFLDVRGSRKRHGTVCCSNGAPRSRFWDGRQGVNFNVELGDPSDEWRRDGETASVAFTHVFGGAGRGSHTFEGGVQLVRSRTSGMTSVAPSGFVALGFPLGATPFAEVDPQTGEVGYNLGDEVFTIRGQSIPVGNLEGVVDNYALYAQDSWQLSKWRFDLGLRWDRYDVSTFSENVDRAADAVVPRVGITRYISPKWQVQATWARYAGKLQDELLRHSERIVDASVVARAYTGPARAGISAEEFETILRDESQWGVVLQVLDPDQSTVLLAEDVELPYNDEFTVGLRAALPNDSGSVTATFIDRNYRNLLEDFVGGLGERTLEDPFTGEPILDGSGEAALFDEVVWDNTSAANRRYRALAATWDYRPGPRWNVGGNWTYSKLTGNQEQGDLLWGTPIGTYERSRPEAAAVPDGCLLDDVRHRLRVWGGYRFDLNRVGALVLGGVGRFQTGGNWSRTADLPLAEDPEYNNEVGQFYQHFFDGRGNNNFDDWWSLDLSARWQFPIFKRLDGWLKATVVNVLNNDAVIMFDTFGTAVDDGSGNLTWEPLGNCGPGDAPSVHCTGFGAIRGSNYYQAPRSYLFTLGLSF